MRNILIPAATLAVATSSAALADGFATSVVDYAPGSLTSADYDNPAAALGGLNADTGFGLTNPFNPVFASDDLVEVGVGGSLTVQLASPASTNGFGLGIHAGVGLVDQDNDFANNDALTGDPVYTFDTDPLFGSGPRAAVVSVSDDGSTFVSLGRVEFLVPTNVDAGAAGPLDPAPTGDLVDPADVFKPFVADLQDFANRDFAGVLDLLDGSAGGTWLDLSGTGLDEVNFVRFDGVADGERFFLDAVVSVSAVPEPTAFAASGLLVSLLLRRRR